MRFTCAKTYILKSASFVEGAVSSKSTIQLLSNMLIEVNDEMVCLSATDLELAIRTEFPAVIAEEGAITVHAKKFIDLLRSFPECELSFNLDSSNRLVVKSLDPKIKANFSIQGIPKDDFPEIKEIDETQSFDFPMESLKRMIAKTIFAVSNDDVRFFLQGIYFNRPSDQENMINFVATDGKRLSFITEEVEGLPQEAKLDVIVPKKILTELTKLLEIEGICKIFISENKIFFKIGNTQLSSTLLGGKFPEYSKIIPKTFDTLVKVNTGNLQKAVERVSKLLDSKSNRLNFKIFSDHMVLHGYHPDFGEYTDEIECEYSDAEQLTIAFNYEFVLDALKEVETDELQIELRGNDHAAILRGLKEEQYYSMIMPMNIKVESDQRPSSSADPESSSDEE